MTSAEIIERIREECPELLLADGFDDAVVGLAEGWFEHSHQVTVCYDYAACINILVKRDGMDEEEAEEYFNFNCLGAYVGEHTPVFLHDWRKA